MDQDYESMHHICQPRRRLLVYQSMKGLLTRLFPPHCRLCGAAARDTRRLLCRACLGELPWLAQHCPQCACPLDTPGTPSPCGHCQRQVPAFDATHALFHYRAPVDHLLKRLKFSGELALGPLLGELLAEQMALRTDPLPQQLIPVPLHPARLRERGFNQATELARAIGKHLEIPPAWRLCQRLRNTQPQSLLSNTARRLNLRNAFSVSGTPSAHVAIVDDVMTTGHTSNELARALKQAGAEKVEVWVIARAGR
jgi:ComF family protein